MSLGNLNSIALILQSIPLGFTYISNTLGFFGLCMNIFNLYNLLLRQLVFIVGNFFFKRMLFKKFSEVDLCCCETSLHSTVFVPIILLNEKLLGLPSQVYDIGG